MTKAFPYILLIITLFIGLLLRLHKINSPVADWHSFRQADTASVTKNLSLNLKEFFVPTYHDLSNLQSGMENPHGYRMVELPVYNFFSLIIYHLHPSSVDLSSRLTTIIFSLLNALLIFLLVLKFSHKFFPSYLALATYLFLPFSIYYSRVILPEQTAIFFMLLSLLLFQKQILLSGISLALSFLIKPYTGIIAFPIFVYLSYLYYRKIPLLLVVFFLISITPFLFWRHWIQNFPAGIPESDWLFWTDPKNQSLTWWRGVNIGPLISLIPFKPYWFRWLFYQRVGQLILASFGLVPFFLGFVYRDKHLQKFNLLSALGIIFYFIIVAGGNIRHDYYQILIIPFISITVGVGLYYCLNFLFKNKIIATVFTFCLIFFTLIFDWYQVKDYYQINNPNIIAAGKVTDKTLPPDALVVAPYNGDTAFLYQTNRSGWPIEIYDFNKLKSDHPKNPLYLVSTSMDTYTNNVAMDYQTLTKNDQFIIIDLNHAIQK